MTWKVWHDGGGGITKRSLDYFKRNGHKLGQIVEINICDMPHFSMEIWGVNGVMLLSGVTCGYGGTGPHGSVKILAMLGVVPSKKGWRGELLPDYACELAKEIFSKRRVRIDLRDKYISLRRAEQ